ncbi:MAG: site-specific integrase, partial [Salinarchaeum sp.]
MEIVGENITNIKVFLKLFTVGAFTRGEFIMHPAHKNTKSHSTMSRHTNPVQIDPMEAAERYLDHRKTEVAADTVRGNSTPIKMFARWMNRNNKSFHQLNGLDLQQFYDHLKRHDSDFAKTTLRNYMTAVRQFLLKLEDWDAAPPGIASKIHRPSLEKGERRREEELRPERAEKIVQYLEKYQYASRDHVIFLIFWRTGIRSGALHSLDLDHFQRLEEAGPVLRLHHRPDLGLPLKNGSDAERPVNLRESTAEVVEDYIEANRLESKDGHGNRPLITSQHGRYSKDQIRKTVQYWTCPKNTGIGSCSCEEARIKEEAQKCEMSRSPHCIRA